MIPGSVLNLCTCFELYKGFVISGCVSISKRIWRYLSRSAKICVFCKRFQISTSVL